MSKLPSIELGSFGPGPREGKPFRVDLDLLMEQNLLLQANSGGGKSWALRRLIEQAYGRLPIVVIDPEGEFSTLRQKFDFLVVGRGGETPAAVQTAPLLARRILELRVSAVCDLFELRPVERARWFAAFVDALVEAPKELWGDIMVAVDEAHDFAPQGGHGRARGDSGGVVAASTSAFAALASKGRKRGQLTVAATQRLGKFDKDVAAELKNVLVGLTWIDVDRERAAESLGIGKAGRADFNDRIKQMQPGDFYGLGRALGLLDPTQVRGGEILTEHPKRGRRQSAPPPPTAKIRHLLPQLSDLPKEAEENLKTEAGLRAEVSRLRAELARAAKAAPARVEVVHQVPLALRRTIASLGKTAEYIAASMGEVTKSGHQLATGLEELSRLASLTAAAPPSVTSGTAATAPAQGFVARRVVVDRPAQATGTPDPEWVPTSPQRRMLTALKGSETGELTRRTLGALSGVTSRAGSFRNNLSKLRVEGCIVTPDHERVVITDRGRELGDDVQVIAGAELLAHWKGRLSGAQAKMLDVIVARREVTREELAGELGLALAGSFRNNLSALRVRSLFADQGDRIVASELFYR